MARKFEMQLKQWIPLIIKAYFIYNSLNTFEIIKLSGGVLRILGGEEQVREIQTVLDFLVNSKFLTPKDKRGAKHFGINFDSYTYDISDKFKELLEEGQKKAEQYNSNDWIETIRVENSTNNTVNVYNFNFTFTLEKLIEIKAGLINI